MNATRLRIAFRELRKASIVQLAKHVATALCRRARRQRTATPLDTARRLQQRSVPWSESNARSGFVTGVFIRDQSDDVPDNFQVSKRGDLSVSTERATRTHSHSPAVCRPKWCWDSISI